MTGALRGEIYIKRLDLSDAGFTARMGAISSLAWQRGYLVDEL